MNRQVVIGGTYRHFKGFTAKVLTVAIHSETYEQLVVYECTRKGDCDHKDGIYARPLEMFLSEVDHSKYPDVEQRHRFELIEEREEEEAHYEDNGESPCIKTCCSLLNRTIQSDDYCSYGKRREPNDDT